jgi:DNA polymerase-3 subunit delta
VAHVGERQQRLLRELEKLALDLGPGAKIGAEEVDALAAQSAERRVWTLADTLVARDREGAVRAYVELREQGERLTSLLYSIVQRMRVAHDVAIRLEAGESSAQVKKTLRMPARAADRLLADVRESDPDRLRRAIETLADLEVDSRGGAAVDEDTAALRAIAAIAT